MLYLFETVVAFVLFGVLLYLPGYLASQVLIRRHLDGSLLFFSRVILGTAFWVIALFALMAAHCFYDDVLYGLALLLSAISLFYWIARLRRFPLGPMPSVSRPQVEQVLLTLPLVVVLTVLFVVTLRPVLAADSSSYQLTVPKLWAASHGFREIPYNVYSNWPLGINLLFGLALRLKDHMLAKLVHYLFGLGVLAALYCFGRRQRDGLTGLLAAVLFLANPVVVFEMCEAYVDIAYSLFFLLSFWFIHEYAGARRNDRRVLLMAGISGGILGGIKLTAAVALVCLSVSFLLTQWRGQRVRAGLKDFALLFALPCAVLIVPWWIKSWYYTGNPVYPFLYDVFGGKDWSSALAERHYAWHQSIGMGRGFIDYVLLPARAILLGKLGPARFDGALCPLWIVWVPLAVVGARKDTVVRHLLLVVLAVFVFWAATSQQMRFLIPVLPLLSLATALSIADLTAAVADPRRRRALSVAVCLAAVGALGVSAADRAGPCLQLLSAYREHGEGVKKFGVKCVFRFIDERLPGDARIMFLNTNGGFFCERDYIADSFYAASHMNEILREAATPDELSAVFRAHGITHVLLKSVDRGINYPPAVFAFLRDPARAKPVSATANGRFVLLELKR